ncbi:alpha/beta fold hydrolase [Caulobacter segnis]|nr:alpha/beta fold hydrolase [Caulobacter segnis]
MKQSLTSSRHFVAVGDRIVHCRRWGEGPVVLAVHGSPQSSRAVAGVAEVLAGRGLCVIAPDTPGAGLSTPLSMGAPETGDFARALLAFADALGLGRFGVYGFHTGACTACALATLAPERVAAAALEGLPVWTEQERADFLANYLPPFAPSWDGAHMAWLWARMEEQVLFFPWSDPTPRSRLAYDLSPLDRLHANAMDLLQSGDGYRAVYRAAFTFRAEDWLSPAGAPRLLMATRDDVLAAHLGRLTAGRNETLVRDSVAELHAAAADYLAKRPGDVSRAEPIQGDAGRGFSNGLTWRGTLAGPGRPLVLLHGWGDDHTRFDALWARLEGRRPVVAFDLSGHGASTPMTGDVVTTLAEAIGDLGLAAPAIVGEGTGGQIAAALADQGVAGPAATIGVEVHGPARRAAIARHGAPALAPEWDGAHLVRAFRVARRERLFHPWFDATAAAALAEPGSLEAADVHRRAVRLLRAADALSPLNTWRLEHDLGGVARRLGERLTVFAQAGDPLSSPAQVAALGVPALPLPTAVSGWASALEAFAS